MTSTRGGIDPSDLYVTPGWAVDAVLPHIPLVGTIVDAGCGEGDILAAMHRQPFAEERCFFVGVELDRERAHIATQRLQHQGRTIIKCADFLTWATGTWSDVVIMNPAFSIALPFLDHALELTAPVHGTVAALLRFNYLVPKCRAEFARKHPCDLGYLPKRPDFVASLKCKAKCGWVKMQRIDAERPSTCPECGKPVTVVTTDSADYAWHLFGPGRGGRYFPLEVP